jgi:hypothetical protein
MRHAEEVVKEKQAILASLTKNYADQIDLKHKNATAAARQPSASSPPRRSAGTSTKGLLSQAGQDRAAGFS